MPPYESAMGSMADSPVAIGSLRFVLFAPVGGIDRRAAVGFEEKIGDNGAHHYFDAARAAEVRETYKHPFWKAAGEMAMKVGGHGGMDFIMDLRWVYCLQNGLPMDTDVYDLATYSSVVELSERSVNSGSRPVDFPDYTRGGWKTAKPFAVEEMDMPLLTA